MKKYLTFLFFSASLIFLFPSCKVKEGCDSVEKYGEPIDNKTGQLSTKRGKSGLFSDKQMKKKR